MVGTVVEDDLEVHNGIAREHTLLLGFLEPLKNGRNIVPRNGAAKNLILELEMPTARQGFHLDPDVAELAAAACLLFMLALDVSSSLDRLLVRNLGRLQIDINVVPLLEPVRDDLDMELAVAGDEELIRVWVAFDPDPRVFLCDPVCCLRDPILVRPGLGFNSERYGRFVRVTPNTEPGRMKLITSRTTGFIYAVSLLGVTGSREMFSDSVEGLVKKLKKETSVPVCVGFGISKPEHAAEVAKAGADGVIIGSKIVGFIEENLNDKKKCLRDIAEFIGNTRGSITSSRL